MSNDTAAGNRKLDAILIVTVMCLVMSAYATYQSFQNKSQIETDYELLKQLQELVGTDVNDSLASLGARVKNMEAATLGDAESSPTETLALIRRDLQEVNKRITTVHGDESELRTAVQKLVRRMDKLDAVIRRIDPASPKDVPVMNGPGEDLKSAKPDDAEGEDITKPK